MWVYLGLSLRKHDLYDFYIRFILSGNQFNASAQNINVNSDPHFNDFAVNVDLHYAC